jgi:hypothetical protein
MSKKPRKIPLIRKNRKHDKIVKDYEKIKRKHLEKLADKMLEEQDKIDKLREKKSNGDFLELF